jgi:uncharacterized membrane protein YgcG
LVTHLITSNHILKPRCAAGLLQGLAAACEQLAALLTQQQQQQQHNIHAVHQPPQQQQQQQAASSVLSKLLSPATAHHLLDAWFHVTKLCPKAVQF